MFKYIVFICLNVFLTVNLAFADEALLDLGLGVFHSGENGPSETKFLGVGVQEDMWGAIKSRYSTGGWIDNTGRGRASSGFIGGQLGLEVSNNGTIASVFTGPSLISTTDNLLGGNFQFYNSFNYGICDRNGNYIGIMYRHFSSAGIYSVNIGRDVFGLELKVSLGR